MPFVGIGRDYANEARFVRFGRKATKHVRTLFDRFWLRLLKNSLPGPIDAYP